MKRSLAAIVLASVLSPLAAQPPEFLTLVWVGDTHGNILAGDSRIPWHDREAGGIARAAWLIRREKQRGQPCLVLHAGDFSIGDPTYNLFFGVPELQLLAQIGFDAVAIGNHEFDLTPFTLRDALLAAFPAGAPYPFLSANVDLSHPTIDVLQRYIRPFTIAQCGGLRVGIFSLTTPETEVLSQPAPVRVSDKIIEIAYASVGELQRAGCDVVVLLSHLGRSVDELVARYVPGIDVIVGGHDHLRFTEPVTLTGPTGDPVYIVQAGAHYRYLGRLRLKVSGGKVAVHQYALVALDARVQEDPSLLPALVRVKQAVEATWPGMYTLTLGRATDLLDEEVPDPTAPGFHDTAVGNLVSDALRDAGGTDLGIEPGGSTSQPVYPGPILPVDLFRAIGYGFNTLNGLGYRVATVRITGMELWRAVETTLARIDSNDEFLVQLSGGSYVYDPGQVPGQRLQGFLIGGQPLDFSKTYTVTTNEFVVGMLAYLGIHYTSPLVWNRSELEVVQDWVVRQGVLSGSYSPRRILAR